MAIPDATLIRLEKQLESLDVVLRGASAALLEVRSPSGEWSARENLAHLARHAKVFLDRLERVLRGDTPDLGTYRAEKDPESDDHAPRPARTLLARLGVRCLSRQQPRDLLHVDLSSEPSHKSSEPSHKQLDGGTYELECAARAVGSGQPARLT
jgi:hypothetical protein